MRTHARLFAASLLVLSASGAGSSVPIASSADAARTEVLQLRPDIGDAERLRAANRAALATLDVVASAERLGSETADAAGDAADEGGDEAEAERGAEVDAGGDAGDSSDDPAC